MKPISLEYKVKIKVLEYNPKKLEDLLNQGWAIQIVFMHQTKAILTLIHK